jgi:hypothetical protein
VREERPLHDRYRLGWCGGVTAAALAALLLATLAPTLASASSLYDGRGPRPGPDILYAPAPDAPQLDNAPGSVWKAPPILISGASAYRSGEFLSQDFLYDDHGASLTSDPADARRPGNTFSAANGTYTYPSDPAYAGDAADLVELRVRPLVDSTALRITLNTMNDPSLIAVSIALGGTPGVAFAFPDGANVKAPADLFLTVHPRSGGPGMVGELVHAGTGAPVAGPPPAVAVDTLRRQIEVRLPHAGWDPTGRTVRLAAGVGLWDKSNQRYLLPGATATSTHPGGAGSSSSPAAFFNVAFRANGQEPMPTINNIPGDLANAAWWRDMAQGRALAAGDISPFFAEVDFAKLAAGGDDETGVPRTGPMDRILASHYETAQGTNFADSCSSQAEGCKGEYQGRLQPYAIYVPAKPQPPQGYGLTLLMHALDSNYNLFEGSRNQSQFGERGPGSIVITPEARGPDGSYTSYAEADVFEAWADVARHYRLDPAYDAVTGYSMGAIGTFKLAEQFPDLFARAFSTSGADSNGALPALRNVPVLMWSTATDEEVPAPEYLGTATSLLGLGYRYELDVFAPGEHNSFAVIDQYAPAAAFLGTARVDRDPAHVTYVVNPASDYPALGLVTDHAYWLSGLRVAAGAKTGTIDAASGGFGAGDPAPSGLQTGMGVLSGGNVLPAVAYSRSYQTWGPVPAAARADRIDITSTGVASAAIDVARAGVDCHVALHVASDVALKITLDGCSTSRTFPASGGGVCLSRRTLVIHPVHPRGTRVQRAAAFIDGRRVVLLRARRGRPINSVGVTLRGLHAGTVRVLIRLRVRAGRRALGVSDRRTYHTCARRRGARPARPARPGGRRRGGARIRSSQPA